jgi:outer membrane protein OmpA-like peptidoglycan-associated protein
MRAAATRSLAVVLALAFVAACGGGGDDEDAASTTTEVEETTTTESEETTTTVVEDEETTTTVFESDIADPDDDANGDGVLDPFCSQVDFGGGLVMQVHCDVEGLTSEVPENVTLVEGSLFGMRSSIHRVLDGISGNLIVSRSPEGERLAVLVFGADVLFASGSAELTQPENFDNVIQFVADNFPGSAIQVRGHTDSVGDPGSNQALSEARAASVQAYLQAGGIEASEVTAIGFGETQPLALEDTEEGKALNRRVEVVIRFADG